MSKNASSKGRIKGIYLRGKIYWFRYSYAGRQQRVSLDTEDEGEAILRAQNIEANPILAGAEPILEELKAFLEEMQESGTYTANTAENRGAVLRKFIRTRRLKEPRDFTESEVKAWLSTLRHGKGKLDQSTVDSYGMMIRAFGGWLKEKNKLRENPGGYLKAKIVTSAKRRRFCRREQVDTLISECPDRGLKFVLFAGFHAGLRKDEIIQARPEWIDLNVNVLEIFESDEWKPKDKDKRAIPITRAFHNFLENELTIDDELPEPFLLKPDKKKGKARYRYDFRKPFDEYVKSKGFGWLKPHMMRHTFASLLAIAGVSIFKIARWLGDDVVVVERHYAHLLPQDADIERAFGSDVAKPAANAEINEAF